MEQTAKQVLEDMKYWKEIERYLPWRLFGFTYKRTAAFNTESGVLYLTASQYEQILKELRK